MYKEIDAGLFNDADIDATFLREKADGNYVPTATGREVIKNFSSLPMEGQTVWDIVSSFASSARRNLHHACKTGWIQEMVETHH